MCEETVEGADEYLAVAREVRGRYSVYADEYASMTASFANYPGLRAEVLGFFDAVAPGPVLDIGCGSGRDGVLGADDCGCWVVFADSALGMLRTALVRRQETVVCCDVTRLPFSDAVFNGVIASGVLLHIPKRHCPSALAELRRVLRPEGRVSISMKAGAGEGWRRTADFPMARWFSFYGLTEFADLCAAGGLRVDDVRSSGRGAWFTVMATSPKAG